MKQIQSKLDMNKTEDEASEIMSNKEFTMVPEIEQEQQDSKKVSNLIARVNNLIDM